MCVFENTRRCIKMQELKLRMTLCHSFMEVKMQRFSVIPEFGTLFFLSLKSLPFYHNSFIHPHFQNV